MAGYGLGPMLGGLVMDRLGGQYIWYAAFANCMLLGLGFLAMSGQVKKRLAEIISTGIQGMQGIKEIR